MRSIGDPAFFRLFDLLMVQINRGLTKTRWKYDGVDFERERHSATGPQHGLTIDIFTLTREGRRGWSLMVIKEYWWVGAESKPLKNSRWARAIMGQRGDIVSWLKAQEAKLERDAFGERAGTREAAAENEPPGEDCEIP
jgi:hypothetical protein